MLCLRMHFCFADTICDRVYRSTVAAKGWPEDLEKASKEAGEVKYACTAVQ